MRSNPAVLVVGAGIAGLTAAVAFARRGFAVRVVEQAGRLEAVGAGIQLSPNALRVLATLDVLPALRKKAVEAEDVALHGLRSGRRLATVPVKGADGTPYLSVLRADLQAALLEAAERHDRIDLRLGTSFRGFGPDGHTARMAGSEGGDHDMRFAALVAADGVDSAVAKALGAAAARSTGHVAYRMTLDAEPDHPRRITAWLDKRGHVVAYPVDAGRRTNVVVVSRGGRRNMEHAFAASRSPFPRTLARLLPEATVWPLLSVDRPQPRGNRSNVVLVGDAAHAMLPFAAQGAALAIEDGFVAAHHLSTCADAGTAWQAFDADRRPRWNAVRRRVSFHRFVYHLPFPFAAGRNLALASRSPASLARDLAWLYDWRPPA